MFDNPFNWIRIRVQINCCSKSNKLLCQEEPATPSSGPDDIFRQSPVDVTPPISPHARKISKPCSIFFFYTRFYYFIPQVLFQLSVLLTLHIIYKVFLILSYRAYIYMPLYQIKHDENSMLKVFEDFFYTWVLNS